MAGVETARSSAFFDAMTNVKHSFVHFGSSLFPVEHRSRKAPLGDAHHFCMVHPVNEQLRRSAIFVEHAAPGESPSPGEGRGEEAVSRCCPAVIGAPQDVTGLLGVVTRHALLTDLAEPSTSRARTNTQQMTLRRHQTPAPSRSQTRSRNIHRARGRRCRGRGQSGRTQV